jgi:two-component system response regulator NreC
VLLADDYPEMIAALDRLLRPSCDVVGHVADGADLVKAVALKSPDVIVVDVRIPSLNGLEACRQIKRLSPEVTVIVLSAADDPWIQQRALELGASAFLPKYRIASELETAIERALSTTAPSSPDTSHCS